jgi:hypothetical protein
MRRRIPSLGLVLALFAGCTPTTSLRPSSFLDRLQAPSGPDVVVMVVAVIERPACDRYLNDELWTVTDEQSVAVDRRAILESNGLRVGQFAGITPDGLQELLLSPRANAAPKQYTTHAGNATSIPLGSVQSECRFSLYGEGQSATCSFKKAQCQLKIVPSLAPDGGTRLEFTPEIAYGDSAVTTKPNADRSGWQMRHEQPMESYEHLRWEVSLAPGEFVVVGTCMDKTDTLGRRCFTETKDDASPIQRLLVIRTGRPISATSGCGRPAADAVSSDKKSPPLALQAAWSTVRGGSQ